MLDPLIQKHADEVVEAEATAWLRLRRLYRRVKTELIAKVKALDLAGKGESFAATHAAALLVQVADILQTSHAAQVVSLKKSTKEAAALGIKQSLAEVEAGEGAPLTVTPLIPTEVVAGIIDEQNSLLMKFHKDVHAGITDSLAESVTLGEGIKPAAQRLAKAVDDERWKLERIARTEINNAVNTAHVAQLDAVITEFPELDLQKQWSADIGSPRTCPHCVYLDGQVRNIDADFEDDAGWTGQQPPRHPACRCRANPWSKRWREGKQPRTPLGGQAMITVPGGVRLQAMALEVPDQGDAPNRHPFEGVLCQLDEPSTRAPEGANGKRVILPTAVAERILPTLLGQGVNYKPDLTGHAVQQKVGVITEAVIEGGEIVVRGLLYDQDFPDLVPAIRAANDSGDEVGMSFELSVSFEDPTQDPLTISDSSGFTGAAILLCKDAAFHHTRLAASAVKGAIPVTEEEFKALMASTMADFKADILASVKAASRKTGKAGLAEDIEHAHDLHAAMTKAMAGYDNKDAMVHAGALGEHLCHMKAAAGDYFGKVQADDVQAAAVQAAAVITPDPKVAELESKLTAQAAEIASLTARAAATAQQPERKTISPAIAKLLAQGGHAEDTKPTAAVIRAALDTAKITDPTARMEALMKAES